MIRVILILVSLNLLAISGAYIFTPTWKLHDRSRACTITKQGLGIAASKNVCK